MIDPEPLGWAEVQADAADRLATAGFASPEVDARRLVEEASAENDVVTVRRLSRFDAMLSRRLAGEPLQYVLGRWGFRRLDLMVDRRVLIPRPETEQVVEVALGLVAHDAPVVVDLGSGSGAIALSVALERPAAVVWAVDASTEATAVTRANLAGLGRAGTGVRIVVGSWFEPLPAELRGRVDLVVTNPPYVAASDPLPAEVADWEPTDALIAGPTGLEAIEAIAAEAPAWLAPGGVLVSEIGETQAAAASALARSAGFPDVEVRPDLAGRDRILVGIWSPDSAL